MVNRRLLMYFSYMGTNYRGLQRTGPKNHLDKEKRAPDLNTVQGILEFGLQKVLWLKSLSIYTSSRTDTKVHALESTAQFDLKEEGNFDSWNGARTDFLWSLKRPYSPEVICQSLNLFLEKNECDIRVKRIVEVPSGFNCRRASSRVYEFRVAVLNQAPHNVLKTLRLSSATDIRELNRCEVILQPFNVQAVQEACKLFLGEWDFSTFMKSSHEDVSAERRIKTIRRFSLSLETIPDWETQSIPAFSIPKTPYDIYTFHVEGSGFLRRQVRRMVGALIGVGKGIIDAREITWMLKNPSEQNWNPKILTMGPNGLYLKQINYSNLEVLRGYLS